MATFLDDRAVAARVLDHIENKTTDVGEACLWREPVAHYRSQERLDREITQVLRRWPTPFCPSAALPEPGSFVAREAAGTPLVAVRGEDRQVRVFRNACRHRGMQFACESGCVRAFTCGYHGWTYGLDGRLLGIPHEYGFPGLDKAEHGLVPVTAVERLGVVFVTQDDPATDAEPGADLPELIGADQVLLASNEMEIRANWKVFLEGFLEGYHIRPTHPESFYPFGFDNLTVLETSGPHSRITFPFKRIKKLADVPAEERSVDGLLTYVYHVFPNVLVAILSHHTNLVILEPVSLRTTKFITYSLTNRGGSPEELERAKRDAEFVGLTGAEEDRAVVSAIQRSIDSGANEVFTFGRFESLIAHFHRTLTAALGEATEQ